MKQTVLMFVLLAVGTIGPFAFGPFIGVAVYYLFAVLRPQFLWKWALAVDVGWSFYVAVATIIATWFYLSRNHRVKSFNWAHGAMLGFAVFVTLSHLFAVNSEISSQWYWEYVKIIVMFFIGSVAVREFGHVKALFFITVLTLGYLAYEVNYLYLVEKRLDIYHEGYGGLDNNGAGLMIAMGIPMAYFLWQAYDRWWRWLFLTLVPVMLHAVLMSYSRGAMLALLLASPLLIVRSVRRKGMILFVVGMLCIVPILAGKEIQSRFFSIEQYEGDRSAQSRFESWDAAWNMALDNPILGVGIRNADLLSYKYGADRPGRAIHSQYLQIAADSGLPALGFYILLLYVAWRSMRRAQRQYRESLAAGNEESHIPYSITCGIESALAVFCIGAAFLSLEIFELPYLLILLALKVPLTLGQEESEVASPAPVPAFAKPVTS